MKESRRRQIEIMITKRQNVSMQELCDTFGVSMNTIRADVAELVKAGVAQKVYGGVRAVEHREVPLFSSRSMQCTEKKCEIAKKAEEFIEDGDILYIDAGTTTMHLMQYLAPYKHVTIVTPSIPVVMAAHEKSNVELIVLPGLYNSRTNAVLDGSTVEYLDRYQHAKAFMGVSALSSTGNLGVSSYLEYELKRTAVSHSIKVFLLTDSSKLGESGLLTYATIEQMSTIFTDSTMPDSFIDLCKSRGTPVIQV